MLRYFPHETKATRPEDLRMENEPCRWSFVYRNPFIGRASSGRDRILRLKLTPSCSHSLSLFCCCLKFALRETRSYTNQKLAAFNTWPSLNTEPTLRQISEETLEGLKLHERNFKHRTTPEQPVKPTEGHPQE